MKEKKQVSKTLKREREREREREKERERDLSHPTSAYHDFQMKSS